MYKVKLNPTGHEFDVEENETILDAAIRQNIGLPYGCRNGFCGSCVATLSAGEINYPEGRPAKLDEEAEGACLTCQGVPATDLELTVHEMESPAEIEPRTMPCKVAQVDHLSHDVVRILLKLPEEQRLQFMAGQYLDFLLEDGRRRAFSIANAPHDDDFIELHIRHVEGGEFTDWVFNELKEKSVLRIEAPLGTFTLDESSERPMIFIAGGTGFAPIKGQIEHAFQADIKRPMKLYWGVRASRDLYLPELPVDWDRDHDNFSYIPVLSEADADWSGRAGWVHEAVMADNPDIADYDVYMAGPPVMIKAAREAFRAAGLADENMFYDSFEYAND